MIDETREQLRARLPDTISSLRARAAEHAPGAPAREAGYRISNQDGEAVVRVYDEIWWLGVNALDLAAELDEITASSIRVEINSPGGDVFDGIAIYNALRNHPAEVTTRVDGIAASIASVIFQAGDRRIMQPSGQVMIHNAWGLTIGDTDDHSDMSQVLAQQDEVIAGIYASASGRDASEFRDLMSAETWLTAERTVEEGLADEVVESATPEPSNRTTGGTLNDQIIEVRAAFADALDHAESIAALRSRSGGTLTNAVTENLAWFRDDALPRVDALLPTEDPGDVWTDEEKARFEALHEVVAAKS